MLVQHEALLFAAVFFAIGVLDELAIDLWYIWLRLTGRARTAKVDESALVQSVLAGPAAVFIPAWHEASVIGLTITHALSVWPQQQLTIYVGCYQNDPATIASAIAASSNDSRVQLVINGHDGPTSKADCLNRLYAAMSDDEARRGQQMRMVLLHDAEDMVDPAALAVLDDAIRSADFVQLPVMALPQSNSRWIGTHYSDEFAEAHGKSMVVRSALRAGIPGAGVGCAIARPLLARLACDDAEGVPFASESLTEDYELGLRIAALGGTSRFLRLRTTDGRLVATRAYFPARLQDAVRQKTRWMHGVALQSWDRLGWFGSPVSLWMQLRDRRGPFAAILLLIAYTLMPVILGFLVAEQMGLLEIPKLSPFLTGLLIFNFLGLAWRALARSVFATREFGWREGLIAVPRMAVSNIIAILAGYRALAAYLRNLGGAPVHWNKTEHNDHPVLSASQEKRV